MLFVLVWAVLRLIRRHLKTCRYSSSRYRRCACPIHVYGTLGGERIRQALDLTSWEAASELVTAWSASGQIGVIRPDIPPLKEAVDKFLADAKAQQLNWETLRKYETLLQRRFLPWCESKGYRLLKQVNAAALVEFRKTWEDSPRYAAKNIERLRSFFRFCQRLKWVSDNPALAVKPPTARPNPTLPFTNAEMKRILAACDKYPGNKDRIKAFVLVMRYAGLRIGDTIALKREHVDGNRIFLYQGKTDTAVYVPVPAFVGAALKKIEGDGDSFFWTGNNIRSAVANWSRYLASIFKIAKVKDAHSHRFRDTFSVSLLNAGVPIEDVSILLGHSSVAITNRYYAPFVKSRRDRLEQRVQAAWQSSQAVCADPRRD